MKKQYQIPAATIFGIQNGEIETLNLLGLDFLRTSAELTYEMGKARNVIDFENGVLPKN